MKIYTSIFQGGLQGLTHGTDLLIRHGPKVEDESVLPDFLLGETISFEVSAFSFSGIFLASSAPRGVVTKACALTPRRRSL